MDLGVKGRTALVLGAGGGIGSAVAVSLAKEGVKIALADIDEAALAETTARLNKFGLGCFARRWDLSDISEQSSHLAQIHHALGPVDILINNTGGPPPSSATGIQGETWTKHFQAMVLSVISLTDKVLPGMRDRKWGQS